MSTQTVGPIDAPILYGNARRLRLKAPQFRRKVVEREPCWPGWETVVSTHQRRPRARRPNPAALRRVADRPRTDRDRTRLDGPMHARGDGIKPQLALAGAWIELLSGEAAEASRPWPRRPAISTSRRQTARRRCAPRWPTCARLSPRTGSRRCSVTPSSWSRPSGGRERGGSWTGARRRDRPPPQRKPRTGDQGVRSGPRAHQGPYPISTSSPSTASATRPWRRRTPGIGGEHANGHATPAQ